MSRLGRRRVLADAPFEADADRVRRDRVLRDDNACEALARVHRASAARAGQWSTSVMTPMAGGALFLTTLS
jgi:hypothetical protein